MNPFNIKSQQFFNELLNNSTDVFLVGGIVRDSFIGKSSKDIDLCVTGLDFKQIVEILTPFGQCDLVGESFGVLKFNPFDMELDEPIDIALPRTEFSTGEGHKDFIVKSDSNLRIQDDLFRRDFTINSIAFSFKSNKFIDPFGGIEDLMNGMIELTNPDAFADDPCRIERAIQFSSRFNFAIESNTWKSICDNINTLKSISPERHLTELDKIFKKGNIEIGFDLLNKSGFSTLFFGKEIEFKNCNTFSDFIFLVSSGQSVKAKKNFKLDNLTFKTVDFLSRFDSTMNKVEQRHFFFNCFKQDKNATLELFNSSLLPVETIEIINELKKNKFPLSFKQLTVNGDDLMEFDESFSIDKTKIGKTLKHFVNMIFREKVCNSKKELLSLLK